MGGEKKYDRDDRSVSEKEKEEGNDDARKD